MLNVVRIFLKSGHMNSDRSGSMIHVAVKPKQLDKFLSILDQAEIVLSYYVSNTNAGYLAGTSTESIAKYKNAFLANPDSHSKWVYKEV